MSRNTDDRRALAAIESERMEDQIAYYRKPFMVLWAAVQEASSELEEDYGLSSDVSQLWVAERLRQGSGSLGDRLAEKAVQHGTSKSNVARAADSDPTNAMRRFPRLRPGAVRTRLLIDEVLDSLE